MCPPPGQLRQESLTDGVDRNGDVFPDHAVMENFSEKEDHFLGGRSHLFAERPEQAVKIGISDFRD